MAQEIHFTSNGIPYLVEFANVSIWPHSPSSSPPNDPSRLTSKGLSRSNTTASEPPARTQKPLPAVPLPVRSNSLKLFRTTRVPSKRDQEEGAEGSVHLRPHNRQAALSPLRTRRRAVYIPSDTPDFPHSTSSIPPPSPLQATDSQATLVACEPQLDRDHEADFVVITPLPQGEQQDPGSAPASVPIPPQSPSDLQPKPAGGLFVQFAPPASDVASARKPSAYRLRRKIAEAVLEAGMDAPEHQKKSPSELKEGGSVEQKAQAKAGDLFRGTYGQMLAAFSKAQLVTTPCAEDGMEEAKRLGALFVANRDGHGGVVLKKVVLWG